MRAIVLVVKHVLIQQAFQMPFIHNDDMVKQIAAAVANPTLGNTVLPWTSETGPVWLNAKALHGVDDFLIEARDQRSGSQGPSHREKLREAAGQPRRCSDASSHGSGEFAVDHAQ